MKTIVLPVYRAYEQMDSQFCQLDCLMITDAYSKNEKGLYLVAKSGEKVHVYGYRGALELCGGNVRRGESYCELAIFKDDKFYTIWFETTYSEPDFFIERVIDLDMTVTRHIEQQRKEFLGKGHHLLHI